MAASYPMGVVEEIDGLDTESSIAADDLECFLDN